MIKFKFNFLSEAAATLLEPREMNPQQMLDGAAILAMCDLNGCAHNATSNLIGVALRCDHHRRYQAWPVLCLSCTMRENGDCENEFGPGEIQVCDDFEEDEDITFEAQRREAGAHAQDLRKALSDIDPVDVKICTLPGCMELARKGQKQECWEHRR